jgi:hypothetical protein
VNTVFKSVRQDKPQLQWNKTPVSLSFNQLALRYIAGLSTERRPTQIQTRINHLSHPLLGFFGEYLIENISVQSVRKFVFRMQENGWHEKKIDACLVTFRACMKYAVSQNWSVDHRLTRPLGVLDEALMADQPVMSAIEFHDLYQELVQDISGDMFH